MATNESTDSGIQQPAKPMSISDDTVSHIAALSSALVPIFRGRFCDILLPHRTARTFAKDEVIYELVDCNV